MLHTLKTIAAALVRNLLSGHTIQNGEKTDKRNSQLKTQIMDSEQKTFFGANRGISTHIQTHVRCVWMQRDVKCSPGNVNYTKRIRYDLRVFIFTETFQRYLFGWAHAACHTLFLFNKTHQNGINLIVIWTHFMNQLTHTHTHRHKQANKNTSSSKRKRQKEKKWQQRSKTTVLFWLSITMTN